MSVTEMMLCYWFEIITLLTVGCLVKDAVKKYANIYYITKSMWTSRNDLHYKEADPP